MSIVCSICREQYYSMLDEGSNIDGLMAAWKEHQKTHSWLRRKLHEVLMLPRRWKLRSRVDGKHGHPECMRPSASGSSSKGMRNFAPDSVESSTLDFHETSATLGSDSDPLGGIIAAASMPVSDVGITVAGGESNQSFRWTAGFETGASEVIVLQLRGKIAEKPVVKAVTVETKISCVTCGKSHKSTEKFCGQCGTALHIL